MLRSCLVFSVLVIFSFSLDIPGFVTDCQPSSGVSNAMLCNVTVTIDPTVNSNVYPTVLTDINGHTYRPMFQSNIYLNYTQVYGSQYYWTGTYTQPAVASTFNCSAGTNITVIYFGQLGAWNSQYASNIQKVTNGYVPCQNAANDTLTGLIYWSGTTYNATSIVYDRYTWSGNRMGVNAVINWYIGGNTGSTGFNLADCAGGPFVSCVANIQPFDVPMYKDLFVSRVDNTTKVLPDSIYNNPKYDRGFYSVDWATLFNSHEFQDEYSGPDTDIQQAIKTACNAYDAKCVGGVFQPPTLPVYDIAGLGSNLNSQYSFSGVGQRNNSVAYGLGSSNLYAMNRLTMKFTDLLWINKPDVDVIQGSIVCQNNLTSLSIHNQGVAGFVSYNVVYLSGVEQRIERWTVEGWSEMLLHSNSISSLCSGSKCAVVDGTCANLTVNDNFWNVVNNPNVTVIYVQKGTSNADLTVFSWLGISAGLFSLLVTVILVLYYTFKKRNKKSVKADSYKTLHNKH